MSRHSNARCSGIRVACAWCLEPMTEGSGPISRISHTLCDRCRLEMEVFDRSPTLEDRGDDEEECP